MSANAKLIRNIIIAVASLALLGGGYYFAVKWEPKTDEMTENIQADETNVMYVVSENTEDISYIHIKNSKSDYQITRTEDSYIVSSLDGKQFSETKVASAFAWLAKLSAIREITGGTSELAQYGLDRDDKYYTIVKKDGSEVSVIIGDEVPTGGEFYCMKKGGDKVYTINSHRMAYIDNTPDDYRLTSVSKIADISAVKKFAVYNNSKPLIKLRPATKEEQEGDVVISTWMVEYPWKETADPDRVMSLIEPFAAIEAVGFASDISSVSFDYSVEISTDDEEYKFSIGGKADETGVYLRNDKNSEVYIVDLSLRTAIEGINPNDYINKLVCLANIADISNAVVKQGDREYIMEPGNEDGKAYVINGKDVEEELFKDNYQIVIGAAFTERGDYSVSGTPYMTITYNYPDGRAVKTNYYDYNEREFVAVRNDGTTVKLLRSEISKIEELFEN